MEYSNCCFYRFSVFDEIFFSFQLFSFFFNSIYVVFISFDSRAQFKKNMLNLFAFVCVVCCIECKTRHSLFSSCLFRSRY